MDCAGQLSVLSTVLSSLLLITGLFFFIAGSVGMLRFPDSFSRLHAVTKADSLGLGSIVAGLMFYGDLWQNLLLLLIWLLVLASGSVSCQLLARFAKAQQDRVQQDKT
ncbi:multicomponent Na+:H+ antiporter subunit G [Rheinheimera pacifica]|uniref:cation:proton antiporter n=1 Tax=Rheinheimera pacifica TaxID=173990 RepID=UPI0021687445|nr:monovalent cation/H(+) antiporter subunit G [Rheinheimera pacifica]MCS4307982.1 multicomponent Na+:H+ antiporter subunit G [Rheinheimera pacifica]